MSLASLLLSGSQASPSKASRSVHVDNELDALFRSNPAPPAVAPIRTSPTPSYAPSPKTSQTTRLKRKRAEQAGSEHPLTPVVEPGVSNVSKKLRAAAVTEIETEDGSGDDTDNDAWLEDSYFSRHQPQNPVPETEDAARSTSASGTEDEDAPPPVHETRVESGRSKTRSRTQKKVKYIPPDESPAQRDARTIFIGNVPIAVVKSKSSQKELKRHFLSLINGAKVESVRYRSVAFASATAPIPTEDTDTSSRKRIDALSSKQQRQHDRAAQWRESTSANRKVVGKKKQEEDGETSEREDSHSQTKKTSYLTPTERKRVAFIKGEFHKAVDTVNAYLVFAYDKVDQEKEPSMDKSAPLHPFEAARLAVERCDGTLFMDRTLRVDRVGQWRAGIGKSTAGIDLGGLGDSGATIFVGNLDFAASEEDLRVWFEGVVSQERGPPAVEGDNEDSDADGVGGGGIPKEKKRKMWVRSVRIVRDRDTQLGKGFAYVRFLDRECVDEILALEPAKLKFAKRKLRVQRCKAVPGTINTPTKGGRTASAVPRAKKPVATPSIVSLPKGDPSLGEKLAGLSKDERKAAKAANMERVQRRVAKKKFKEGVQKAQVGKERRRERTRLNKNRNGGSAKVVSKGRVRSEKSLTKRNAKK